ncbi:MAG: hypothetical protein SOI26_03105 [Coriobacteriales bacterium]|jgi:hypothetical protein
MGFDREVGPVTTRRGLVTAGAAALAAAGAAGWARREVARASSPDASGQDASGERDGVAPSGHALTAADVPAPSPDPNDTFGVDLNVNVKSIDDYLGIPGVAYRDVRMVFDTADWGAMGADPDLTTTIEGFEVVPYPYLATLEPLPVDGAYDGDRLFTLAWDDQDSLDIASATPNYAESMTVLEELFPRDQLIFLMCGGGGYAYMTKKLLVYLGWDESAIYNLGGQWYYEGTHGVTLIERGEAADGGDVFALWRADIPRIDFDLLHPAS